MEKHQSFVINGGIKLPIGYRFCPTDEELVIHYLKRKLLSHPLPANVIPDLDVFRTHPDSLPGFGDSKEKRYFFSHGIGNASKRRGVFGCGGYWKTVGKQKLIVASETKHVVGMRRTLVFCEGKKRSHETKTQWVMNELRLLPSETPSHPSFQMAVAEWGVYRLFQRRKLKRNGCNRKKAERLEEETKPNIIDFTVEYGSDITGPPPPPSSP